MLGTRNALTVVISFVFCFFLVRDHYKHSQANSSSKQSRSDDQFIDSVCSGIRFAQFSSVLFSTGLLLVDSVSLSWKSSTGLLLVDSVFLSWERLDWVCFCLLNFRSDFTWHFNGDHVIHELMNAFQRFHLTGLHIRIPQSGGRHLVEFLGLLQDSELVLVHFLRKLAES